MTQSAWNDQPMITVSVDTPKLSLTYYLLGLPLLLAVFVGCGLEEVEKTAAADLVARVGETSITVADLEAEWTRRYGTTGRATALTNLDDLLEDMVDHQARLTKARAAGYDTDPEVRRQIERLIITRYETKTRPNPDLIPQPTAAEIEHFYQDHQGEFIAPEKTRFAMIRLRGSLKATAERREVLRSKAEELREQVRLAADGEAVFADLARRYSEDRASAPAGGDLGWVSIERRDFPWPAEVQDAMRVLREDGGVSPVVEAKGDLYLLRLTSFSPPSRRPLSEVTAEIRHRLIKERREGLEREYSMRQREGIQIEINEKALGRVSLPSAPSLATAQVPPRMPK